MAERYPTPAPVLPQAGHSGRDISSPLATTGGGPARWITWRSVLLGTMAVILVCGLTPYNDYVLESTYVVGSYFPLALVLFFFGLIVIINGPLHRFAPRHALSSGELAVVMAMLLVSCSLPSQGWMRSFLPTLVAPFYYGTMDPQFWNNFTALGLPDWLFPVESVEEGNRSRVMLDFYGRVQEDGQIPWGAWVVPLAGWGVFIAALLTTLLALAILIRPQWAVNERLPFPIVQLQLALIEQPRPGRMLNDLLASRSFWIALVAVVFIQSTSALHAYYPRYVPEIPLTYDLHQVMANEPWVYFPTAIKSATVFFTFVGITYFIQSRVSFSLWAIYLLVHIIGVQQRTMQREIPGAAWNDQYLGAAVVFVIGFLWIGRHHWTKVLRQTFIGAREGEDRGNYLSYRTAMILVMAGNLVMIGWLLALDVSLWVAVMIVAFLMMVHLVVARLVAETGIPYLRAYGTFSQIYTNLPPAMMTGRDVFFAGAFTMNGHFTTRESLLPFSMHGLQTMEATQPQPKHRAGLLVLVVWALALGFVVAVASSLYCYYTYTTPVTDRVQTLVNFHALERLPRNDIVGPLNRHSEGRYAPRVHSPLLHMGIGAGVTGFLQVAALRWTGWPFMPVGYLMSSTFYAHVSWFSILLGWLCKVMIVKYGGASLFQKAKPFFVGMIFGEAVAAGIWLIITLILAQSGYDYHPVTFLPT